LTKNHRNDSENLQDGGIILFEENEFGLNPGVYMERFLSKLHPDSEYFLQKPQRKSQKFDLVANPDCWFEKYKVGENMVAKMLPQLSEAAGVPRLTNGQVRPTSVCLMARAGMEDREICTVTGHKNSDSLKHYNPHLTEARKIQIAQAISNGGRKRPVSDPIPSTSKAFRLDQEQLLRQGHQNLDKNGGENQENVNPAPNYQMVLSQANGGRQKPASDPSTSLVSRLDQGQNQENVNPGTVNQQLVFNQNIISRSVTFGTENDVTPMKALQIMILNEQRIAASGVHQRSRIINAFQKSLSKEQ
jgi:hypothetical protein